MNSNLKSAAFFVAGVVVGGTGVYFATRKAMSEHYSQIAADDIRSVKEYYHNKVEEVKKKEEDEYMQEKLEKLGYWSDTQRPEPSVLKEKLEKLNYWADNHRPDPSVLAGDGETDISDEEDSDEYVEIDEETETRIWLAKRDLSEPHLITQDEYDDNDDFSKSELTYFEGDDTLQDEDETIIYNPTPVLGDFDTKNFGHNPDEPDLMLVRNPRLRTDYTVSRDIRSYTSAVLGIEEDPDEKPPIRKMRSYD